MVARLADEPGQAARAAAAARAAWGEQRGAADPARQQRFPREHPDPARQASPGGTDSVCAENPERVLTGMALHR